MSYVISVKADGGSSLYVTETSKTHQLLPVVYDTFEEAEISNNTIWKGYGKVEKFDYLKFLSQQMEHLESKGLKDSETYEELSDEYQAYALDLVENEIFTDILEELEEEGLIDHE